MGWPRIPGVIMTDKVTWTPVTGWTQDAALGRVPAYGATTGPYTCSVQPDSASMADEHGRQGQTLAYTVMMASNPGIKLRDKLTWVMNGRGLTVVGVHPTGDGSGQVWQFDCEEHPTT